MEFTCYRPPGMITASKLSGATFWRIAGFAADIATRTQEPITILGASPGAAVLCRMDCQFTHPDSVILIPDVVLIELVANGFDEVPTAVLKRSDGRSVHAYRTPHP